MIPDPSDQPEPFPYEKVPPDLLEWARQTLDVEDFLTQIREIKANGGLAFEDFIGEVEARARSK
jgi:hypothetical protein